MSYPVPPPSYGASGSSPRPHHSFTEDETHEPLLGGFRSPGQSGGGIYDQPAQGDLPDDFKVSIRSVIPYDSVLIVLAMLLL